MRILVTGSEGLLGRWTVPALREAGHEVHEPRRQLQPQVRPPRAQRARPKLRAKPAALFGPGAKRSVRTVGLSGWRVSGEALAVHLIAFP